MLVMIFVAFFFSYGCSVVDLSSDLIISFLLGHLLAALLLVGFKLHMQRVHMHNITTAMWRCFLIAM